MPEPTAQKSTALVVVTNTTRDVKIGPRIDGPVRSVLFAPGRNEVDADYWAAVQDVQRVKSLLARGILVEGEPKKPEPKPAAKKPAAAPVSRATQVGQAARDAARGKSSDGGEG